MGVQRNRRLGLLVIASSIIAIAGFAVLAAALAAPPPAPGTLRRSEDLFRWQDGVVLVQALMMFPVSLGLRSLWPAQVGGTRSPLILAGLLSQAALAGVLLIRFADLTADLVYMIPQGLVGAWVIAFNVQTRGMLNKWVRWLGMIAGFGLLLVGAGALIYGVFVAPEMFVRPLTDAEIDAQTWTQPNIIAHICMAAGTLLGRALYPVWLLILGIILLRAPQATA
jgi:hypothetical protein